MSASAEDPLMMGEDQSEGSGGSGAGQDGEALVKPDAISPALFGPASKSAATILLSIHPQRALFVSSA